MPKLPVQPGVPASSSARAAAEFGRFLPLLDLRSSAPSRNAKAVFHGLWQPLNADNEREAGANPSPPHSPGRRPTLAVHYEAIPPWREVTPARRFPVPSDGFRVCCTNTTRNFPA